MYRDSQGHTVRTCDSTVLFAYDEGLPQPFRVKFRDHGSLALASRGIVDSWRGSMDKGAASAVLSLLVSDTPISADGRILRMTPLE